MELAELGQDILQQLKERSSAPAEVFLIRDKHLSISVLEQRIEELKGSEELGLAVRIIADQKMGFAYTSDLSPEAIERCLAKALENNAHNTRDKNWGLAKRLTSQPSADLDLYDGSILTTSLQEKIAKAMEIEKAAKAFDRRVVRTESVSYFDTITSRCLLNSEGLDLNYSSTYCGGMADVLAEADKNLESGSSMDFAIKLNKLDLAQIGAEAAEKACQLLGAKTPQTQKTVLVFPPDISCEFLALLSTLFLASNVQKSRSFLAGRLGEQVASALLNITDHGLLPEHIGTSPFDDEGTLCQKTILLQSGVLKDYLYNIYTAAKAGHISTGNAGRSSYLSLPEVVPTNLYIEPGTLDRKEMLSQVEKGIYVTKLMGMHTANPISGDYSLGLAGLNIINGRFAGPIRGGAIAGNLKDLLNSIKAIGNDLHFYPLYGNIGSPTLLISDISVSGS